MSFKQLFQLLLKGCTIEAGAEGNRLLAECEFQLLLKGCTIEASGMQPMSCEIWLVSVVVERMYD